MEMDSITEAAKAKGHHQPRPLFQQIRCLRFPQQLLRCQKTVELKPDWSKGYSRLGTAHVGLHNYNEAVEAYKKGLEIDPNNEALKSGLYDAQSAATTQSKPPNLFGDAFGSKIWAKLTSDPSTRVYMQQPDFQKPFLYIYLYLPDFRFNGFNLERDNLERESEKSQLASHRLRKLARFVHRSASNFLSRAQKIKDITLIPFQKGFRTA